MKKIIFVTVFFAAVIFLSSCASFTAYQKNTRQLEFVPTDYPGFYYIVDKVRNICFFHSVYKGYGELVEVDCNRILNPQSFNTQPNQPQTSEAVSDEPEVNKAKEQEDSEITDQDIEKFKKAYVEIFCLKQKGTADIDYDAIYKKNGISEKKYEQILVKEAGNKKLWNELTGEALKKCTNFFPDKNSSEKESKKKEPPTK